jgi:type IV secretion system protein VirB9
MMILVATLLLWNLAAAPAAAQGNGGPIHSPDGSYRFTYGADMPTIRVGVGDSCDIEFQAGESIRRAFLSDTVRWKLADGVSGPANIPHLLVKPTQAKISATLTVLTDRRAYHIRLLSTFESHPEYVGFQYPSERPAATASAPASASVNADEEIIATYTCGAKLDSAYTSSGANEFRDAQICNDGKHTYINVPEWRGDLPMPYLLDNGVDEIANYSYDPLHRQFIIDGAPTRLALIRGTGRGQSRTTFTRKAP